jgi:hypothetical protein
MMNEIHKYLFPGLIILESLGASIMYGFSGDYRRMIYWFAGTVITSSVTF